MPIDISSGINEHALIEDSERITNEDTDFSHEFSEGINHAAIQVLETFSTTQQLDLIGQINATLETSADNLIAKDIFQAVQSTEEFSPELTASMNSILKIFVSEGERLDPIIRNDPLLRKSFLNSTFTILGIGSFNENFKFAEKAV